MRARTHRVHGIDTEAHLPRVDVRPYAMTEVEDMPRALAEVREHRPDLGGEPLGGGA